MMARVSLLAASSILLAVLLGCSEPERPKNVVLILLDTLRADHLSSYGYPVETSPVLDDLARQGVLFETVVSNAPWTLPAMAGLFSGDFPTKKLFDETLHRSLVDPIHDAGLRTAAFVEGGFLSEKFGFARGFDTFHDGAAGKELGVIGKDGQSVVIEETFRAATEWLRENHDEPFFLVIHTYEPHTPYRRMELTGGLDPGGLGETFEVVDVARIRKGLLDFGSVERTYVKALYDSGVLTSDRHVGELLEILAELGVRDQTAIVVTSDHGEDIGGREPEWPGVHGQNLYDELLLVPLIIHDPTRSYPVQRVTRQVRTIDTLHTVLDLLGLPAAESNHGRSLLPLMRGEEEKDRFAWSAAPKAAYFDFEERYALRTGAHKLIMSPMGPGGNRYEVELYDLASDPGERSNTAEVDAERRLRLRDLLLGLREGLEADGVPRYRIRMKKGMDTIEGRLRELGYVE
jgi:arylsulfatase A-like enzyme